MRYFFAGPASRPLQLARADMLSARCLSTCLYILVHLASVRTRHLRRCPAVAGMPVLDKATEELTCSRPKRTPTGTDPTCRAEALLFLSLRPDPAHPLRRANMASGGRNNVIRTYVTLKSCCDCVFAASECVMKSHLGKDGDWAGPVA